MFRARSWIRHAGVCARRARQSLSRARSRLPHAEGPTTSRARRLRSPRRERPLHRRRRLRRRERDADHCFLCHSLRSFHPAFDKYEQQHGTVRAPSGCTSRRSVARSRRRGRSFPAARLPHRHRRHWSVGLITVRLKAGRRRTDRLSNHPRGGRDEVFFSHRFCRWRRQLCCRARDSRAARAAA